MKTQVYILQFFFFSLFFGSSVAAKDLIYYCSYEFKCPDSQKELIAREYVEVKGETPYLSEGLDRVIFIETDSKTYKMITFFKFTQSGYYGDFTRTSISDIKEAPNNFVVFDDEVQKLFPHHADVINWYVSNFMLEHLTPWGRQYQQFFDSFGVEYWGFPIDNFISPLNETQRFLNNNAINPQWLNRVTNQFISDFMGGQSSVDSNLIEYETITDNNNISASTEFASAEYGVTREKRLRSDHQVTFVLNADLDEDGVPENGSVIVKVSISKSGKKKLESVVANGQPLPYDEDGNFKEPKEIQVNDTNWQAWVWLLEQNNFSQMAADIRLGARGIITVTRDREK